MLRIAVIGAGRIGKVHAATVAAHPQARLVLVCDPFIEAAKALAEPLGARASADAAEAPPSFFNHRKYSTLPDGPGSGDATTACMLSPKVAANSATSTVTSSRSWALRTTPPAPNRSLPTSN